MRKLVGLGAAIAVASVGLPAHAEDLTIDKMTLRASEEPARQHQPPCMESGERTDAQELFGMLSKATDAYLGAPVTKTISEAFPEKDAWKAARLGIHNGKSVCGTICAVVPDKAVVKGCMYDHETKETSCRRFKQKRDAGWGIGWMNVVVSEKPFGVNKMACVSGSNWSHNRKRTLSLRLSD